MPAAWRAPHVYGACLMPAMAHRRIARRYLHAAAAKSTHVHLGRTAAMAPRRRMSTKRREMKPAARRVRHVATCERMYRQSLVKSSATAVVDSISPPTKPVISRRVFRRRHPDGCASQRAQIAHDATLSRCATTPSRGDKSKRRKSLILANAPGWPVCHVGAIASASLKRASMAASGITQTS